jgi:asparagine synthase (glutamine-hydrolysing)
MGHNLLISGQGPDEIFAGYARHVRIFKRYGEKALQHELMHNLSITHEANIARDMKAVEYFRCEAFFPYLSHPFIQYGLSIPTTYKVAPEGKPQRKVVFRKLCAQMGLPEKITNEAKSATQYSSGSSKLLQKAIAQHVKKLEDTTRRGIREALPDVLKQIGSIMGLPGQPKRKIASKTELEHVYRHADGLWLTTLYERKDNN